MDSPTKRQREILDFVVEYIAARGYSPSVREIGIHFDISSTNGVNDHLRALERKGYLVQARGKSRSWRPTEEAERLYRKEEAMDLVGKRVLLADVACMKCEGSGVFLRATGVRAVCACVASYSLREAFRAMMAEWTTSSPPSAPGSPSSRTS